MCVLAAVVPTVTACWLTSQEKLVDTYQKMEQDMNNLKVSHKHSVRETLV